MSTLIVTMKITAALIGMPLSLVLGLTGANNCTLEDILVKKLRGVPSYQSQRHRYIGTKIRPTICDLYYNMP